LKELTELAKTFFEKATGNTKEAFIAVVRTKHAKVGIVNMNLIGIVNINLVIN
jgi:hypothetical protein